MRAAPLKSMFTAEKRGLRDYLEEIERSSQMQATLVDSEGRDIVGRGTPSGAEGALTEAQSTEQSRFWAGMRWKGASVVSGPAGQFVFVAEVIPYRGLLIPGDHTVAG
jgi:hypothetical protein